MLSRYQKIFRDSVTSYHKKTGRKIYVLAIAGPNGGGKTTIIENLTQKFPQFFIPVIQVGTRPTRENDYARKYLPPHQFDQEKIVLAGKSGLYQYGYTLKDLEDALYTGKILIFEGISCLEKLTKILPKALLSSLVVGVLPPGRMSHMIQELRKRLSSRSISDPRDIELKLAASETRVIPEVLEKSHLVLRSAGFRTHEDIEKIMTLIQRNQNFKHFFQK